MKKLKKVLSLAMVFAIVLTVIPAIPAQAETVTIKKTAKEKYVIKKFDDQADIDEIDVICGPESHFADDIALINECGGWIGLTELYHYEYDDDINEYVLGVKQGTYLNPHSLGGNKMTKSQVAQSLKAMYGKYSCIKVADLSNTTLATDMWVRKKLVKIARKRYCDECADHLEAWISTVTEHITKMYYAYIVADVMRNYPGMDPRVAHEYEEE